MRILVTRPEPDATTFAERLADDGHDVYIEPMMEVRFDTGEEIDLDEVQALIATSRNGVRALEQSPALETARQLPLFAVGPGTATLARSLGITRVIAGGRDAAGLMPLIAERAEVNGGALLHLAGDRMAFDLAGELSGLGFTVLQPTVYRSEVAGAFSEDLIACLVSGEIEAVTLFSPRTAQIFCRLLIQHDLTHTVRNLTFFCLSEAVAHHVGALGAARVEVAGAPNLQEMLCLVSLVAAKSKDDDRDEGGARPKI